MAFLAEFFGSWAGKKALDYSLTKLRAVFSRKAKPAENWKSRIERALPDAKIHGILESEPKIELAGRVKLTPTERAKADALKATLHSNEAQAMLNEPLAVVHNPLTLRVQTLDYSELEVLRYSVKHLPVLTGGALVICPEKRSMIFHHRSRDSRTFPNHMHLIGGNFKPAMLPQVLHDHASLLTAMHREVHEEIGTQVAVDASLPMILGEEISERFLQFLVLGARITAEQLGKLRPSWEGEGIVTVGYDELESFLKHPPVPWVPTGKAYTLAWLALGAPGAGRRPCFGKYKPQELFSVLV